MRQREINKQLIGIFVTANDRQKDAIIVVGHSLVTSYGLWMLMHPDEIVSDSLSDLTASHVYKTDNASALVLDYDEEQWAVTDRIIIPE